MNQELILKKVIMNKIASAIKEKAIKLCPIDIGTLRASIDYDIKGDNIYIYAEGEGAVAMEYGSPPGLLDDEEKEAIMQWGERHGLDKRESRSVIRHIEKKGIKAGTPDDPYHVTSLNRDSYRPFLRPAIYQTIPEIPKILKGA